MITKSPLYLTYVKIHKEKNVCEVENQCCLLPALFKWQSCQIYKDIHENQFKIGNCITDKHFFLDNGGHFLKFCN